VASAATQSSCRVRDLYPSIDWGSEVIVLGIESTSHTFGVGIASSKPPYILAEAKHTYIPEKGGIHPREAAQHHVQVAPRILMEALSEAGLSIRDVDAVAVALGPGLGPCLRVGATVARALAAYYHKPLVPVNHALAHIEIGRLYTCLDDPVVLYVSGGNTLVAAYAKGRYRVFGETLDIALGNLLDAFARDAPLPGDLAPPPYVKRGMHVVDLCAERGSEPVDLPLGVVKGQDVTFSGLYTAAVRAARRLRDRVGDVCLAFREIAYSAVVEVTERCLVHTRKKQVLLVGGVAASPVLREKLASMTEYHGASWGAPPPRLAGDNGAMIAWLGLLNYMAGLTCSIEDAVVKQRWRLDDTPAPWRA